MSELINLTNPLESQILVWDSVQEVFINVDASADLLNINEPSLSTLSPNHHFIRDVVAGVIESKGLIAGDNVTITDNGTDITVNAIYPTDALTLNGFGDIAFVKKSELDGLIDIQGIQDSLDVYTTQEVDDTFVKKSESMLPSSDNTQDIGSNGNRYADVYAVTFHGLATNAIISQTLDRNNANEEDVLTWKNGAWAPTPIGLYPIGSLEDVQVTTPVDNDVLVYDSNTLSWVNSSIQDIIPEIGELEYSFLNVGGGFGLFKSEQQSVVELRTILPSSEFVFVYSIDDTELNVSLSTEVTDRLYDDTDQIPEGSINLFHTTSRVQDALLESTVNHLPSFNINELEANTNLVWNGTEVVNNPIPLSNVDTLNASVGDLLQWDGTDYALGSFSSLGASLSDLSDVSTQTPVEGDVIVHDGTEYVPTQLEIYGNELRHYWIKINYDSNGDVATTESNDVRLSVSNTGNLLTITVSEFMHPPMGAYFYGYNYDDNTYLMNVVGGLRVSGLGISGSPEVFNERDPNNGFIITVTAGSGSTVAINGSNPGEDSHAYLILPMGH